jgi:hypothetical protein
MACGRKYLGAIAVVALATAVGCAHSRRTYAPSFDPGAYGPYELPSVERGKVAAQVSHEIDLTPSAAPAYVALAAAEAQCLAVENSGLANLLDREHGTVCRKHLCKHDRCQDSLRRKLLHTAAREVRNKNGADALRLYYGITEAESGLDLIDEAEPIVADVLAKADELKTGQLSVPFDRSDWERRLRALAAKRAELAGTRAKLNAQLRTMLGYESTPDDPWFWPAEAINVDAGSLDAESEVAYGMATRAHLQLLRELPCYGAESIKDVVRELLSEQHGMLGMKLAMSGMSCKKLLGLDHDCEPCARVGQIRELSRKRENDVAGEIRAAVRVCDERRRRTAELEMQIGSWEKRVSELEQKRSIAESSFVESAGAKLQLLEARQAVVSAAIDFRRAEVDLHEAQGAIEAECRGLSSEMIAAELPAGEVIPAPKAD